MRYLFVVVFIVHHCLTVAAFRVDHRAPAPAIGIRNTRRRQFSARPVTSLLLSVADDEGHHYQQQTLDEEEIVDRQPPTTKRRFLIHWKGEDVEGYSAQFRHDEFKGALGAVLGRNVDVDIISFQDALHYDDSSELVPDIKRISFNTAMQYVVFDEVDTTAISTEALVQTASRCSLVHALYLVVAEAESYDGLALDHDGFQDIMRGGVNENATWCLRARNYSSSVKKYSSRARSMTCEREVLLALKPLLLQFGGQVDLNQPDCKIYVFDGLDQTTKVLARRLATGPKISSIAPITRVCITNTPLEPIAAFVLCNVAGVYENSRILDPFCGSGAILLAANMIEKTVMSVGIDIAHDGLVNRQDIVEDFRIRNLIPPLLLLQGDSTHDISIRQQARINQQPFDFIITDPPYGIRESQQQSEKTPLTELFECIAHDNQQNNTERLLRVGGKLVAFVPVYTEEQDIQDCLPSQQTTNASGLTLNLVREQVLNDKLSRWLVSYTCIK